MKNILDWIVAFILDMFTEIVVIEPDKSENVEEYAYIKGIHTLLSYRTPQQVSPDFTPEPESVTWSDFVKYNRTVNLYLGKT